jgi:aspartate/methionine/tyrosine aminotransferase
MTLPLFDLNEWFARAAGRFDLSLSHSACQSQTVADFLHDGDWKSFANVTLNYGAFEGLAELRQVIADQYESVEPSHVMTFNGPSEAIYTFMRALLKPDDTVVAQSPLFQTLHSIARHSGCNVKEWRPADELSCLFDVSDLAAICDESTKLIVINFPHNPTGQTISEFELRRIVGIAQAVDAMLFSDEVFRLLELAPYQTLPAACDLYEKAVSVAGLSKPFGLAGLRIGWIVTKCDEIRSAAKRYRYNTVGVTNTPCQWLACRALRRKDEVLARNRAMISANLDRLEAFVETHNETLKLFRPKAGTMAVVEQRTKLTSTELCERILDEERLFLIPGKPLGMPDRVLRFGLGMSDFPLGLERFDRFLKRLNASDKVQ